MNRATASRSRFAPVSVEREDLAGGAFVLRSTAPLGPYPDNLCRHLERWAVATPERRFLAERDAQGGWRTIGYGAFRDQARALASAFLERGIGPEMPIMLLSDNGIDNALIQFGAIYAGIPAAPVSPAYSLIPGGHARLRHIYESLRPRLLYARDGHRFEPALGALDLDGVEVVVSRDPPGSVPSTPIAELLATPAGPEVEHSLSGLGPDTVAKILFTSGSTGRPKGVINTHRMLCANQQAILQLWPFLEERPPVIVDWLPWHHTFGGNHNFNLVLSNGGTLYIDEGKPAPGLFETSIANLREVSATIHFNVPRGYDMLLPHLEQDAALRERFFAELDLLFYAAAALPQTSWQRLESLAPAARGARGVTLTTAWGTTETAPMATCAHFPLERAGNIGVPAPGTEIKLVPNGDKLELRVRGPNVAPGYFRDPDLTRAAFDADGFYLTGDAGRLADPAEPGGGILFDGRIPEDFKLSSGSWVSVGSLRVAAVSACDPLVQDAVVTGHDRDEVGLLIFPSPAGCARALGLEQVPTPAELAASRHLREALRARLTAFNADQPGTSGRIARLLVLAEPPSLGADEITDKGYINQRAVLARRADLVEFLYRPVDADEVVVLAD